MSGILLKVRVNPRSSCDKVAAWRDGILYLKLTAPPVEGAANAACVRFLADRLRLKKSQITLIAGHSSRDKIIQIEGISESELTARLSAITTEG